MWNIYFFIYVLIIRFIIGFRYDRDFRILICERYLDVFSIVERRESIVIFVSCFFYIGL